MISKGKIIRNKLLYTIANDSVLLGLWALNYYFSLTLSNSSNLSKLLFITLLIFNFYFYLFRAFTVSGKPFNSNGNDSLFVLLRSVFWVINLIGVFLLFGLAKPVLVISLIGINTLLISWTQYYRIVLLLCNRYQMWDGQILSVEKHVIHVHRSPNVTFHVVLFEHENGETISVCIDKYTYYCIKGKEYPKAKLVLYYFSKDKIHYEIILNN